MVSTLTNTLSARIIIVTLVAGTAFTATQIFAATDTDATALQHATATCKGQVKEQAKFHEMSWYARRKAVKNCIKKTLAEH
jgi:hypothetical protein